MALCGMWKSPMQRTNTMLPKLLMILGLSVYRKQGVISTLSSIARFHSQTRHENMKSLQTDR